MRVAAGKLKHKRRTKTSLQPNYNAQGAETPAETPLHTQQPPPAQPQEALILAEELQRRVRRPQQRNSAPHRPPFPYTKENVFPGEEQQRGLRRARRRLGCTEPSLSPR
ncbi:uncharacterized protein FYW23_013434 [Sylvia borin]